jgi:mono/diheme cytochrome c family protein
MHHLSSRPRPLLALLSVALALTGTARAFAKELSPISGAQLYRQHCAACHGKGGEGDGPVAPFFKLLPPDLTLIARRSGGTYPAERVRRIIDGREIVAPHGAREMTVWGLAFAMNTDDPVAGKAAAEASISRLVEYLRSIQKAPAQ